MCKKCLLSVEENMMKNVIGDDDNNWTNHKFSKKVLPPYVNSHKYSFWADKKRKKGQTKKDSKKMEQRPDEVVEILRT